MGATPFHHSILEVRLPKHFDKPTDMRYDGTQDPQEHLTAFEARMNLEGVDDEFTTCIAKAKHPINLLGVRQRSGKPTRKYLDRFNDECLEIDGLIDSVTSLCLMNGLLNEDFRKHLTTKPVWTMQEIQNVAREYINDEEVSQVVAANKRQPAYNPARQPGNRERPKEHSKDGAPAKAFKPFPQPRELKDRTRGNKNLYCDYHKGFGHKTQNCFDLKDALEQAVPKSKLAEFSHLIREPRRWDRDRSGNDRSRVVRPRQEPEEDNERGLTIVRLWSGETLPPGRSQHAGKMPKSCLCHRPVLRLPPGGYHQYHSDQRINGSMTCQMNPPMEITARVGTGLVRRILIDTRADLNIMFRNVFDALGLRDTDLKTHQHGVVGLGNNFINLDGVVSLPISIGGGQGKRSVMEEFIVLRDSTAYNIILGRKTINEFGAVIFTKLLMMKFVADDGSVGSIRGDLKTAVACDNASLSPRKKSSVPGRS
ncbi:uncharacterized protein LOC107615993 [Arachis ipaensis]|uniref:uncharacterized protein LOC107615993 n=1 Tax=Arachis ipaensis TaxID=130454 RepID=UPI0007AF2525|nr:uncharacterized protein LOC107615993 [Arachis ipaensis]